MMFNYGGDSEINDSDLVGSSFSSSASSVVGISPCDDSKDDGDDDACLEEAQQGFLGLEQTHNNNGSKNKKKHLETTATPKTLFGGTTGNSGGDGKDIDNDLYPHDRNKHGNSHSNSDSNSSTEDLQQSRRVAMIMASTTLPPRNNSSREKHHRRRTRSSSRRSIHNSNNNKSSSSSSSSPSPSPLSDDYEFDFEHDHTESPIPVRRRTQKCGSASSSSSASSSHKRRSHFTNTKQRPPSQTFEEFSMPQPFVSPRQYTSGRGASEYLSPGFSSESSPDSSPSRSVADMYRVQHANAKTHHRTLTPSQQEQQQQQRFLSSPRMPGSGKSGSGLGRGTDSPSAGSGIGSPYGSSLHSARSSSTISRSPSSAKLGNNAKAKLLTPVKTWCLLGTLIGMVLLSMSGMILLTNQAVPALDSPEDYHYAPTLPDRSGDDTGLRGKKVLGRMWDTSATIVNTNVNANTNTISEEAKRGTARVPGIGKQGPKKTDGASDQSESSSSWQGGSNSASKKPEKPVKRTRVMPQRLKTMRMPPLISFDPGSKFDEVDPNLYHHTSVSVSSSSFSSKTENAGPAFLPRVVVLDPSVQPITRSIEAYPADFTDNTQLYGVLPSDDERMNRMEMREPYSTEECVPMQDWQTAYQPSCNGMHELALQTLGASTGRTEETTKAKSKLKLKPKLKLKRGDVEGLDATLFGTKGFWRYAWKLVIGHQDHRTAEVDTIVFKNLKYEHNFEDAHFEHDRVDAVAMERLTSSPHVINIFGFCGHSVLTEYADGKRLGELADKSKKIPLRRLEIARDIATGLADVHGIDGDGNTTFVHLDINPANVVSVNQTLKLNDFNIGIIRQWNTTSNEACGFPTQYPNPQWRSPEEARNEQHLTEKVDIFSLGHIFFRLICGHEPWNKLEPGGRPTKEEINEKVQRGDLPHIPESVMNSDDPEIAAIRAAMLKCYRFDPTQRPSARKIANTLDRALEKLQRKLAKKNAAATATGGEAKPKTE